MAYEIVPNNEKGAAFKLPHIASKRNKKFRGAAKRSISEKKSQKHSTREGEPLPDIEHSAQVERTFRERVSSSKIFPITEAAARDYDTPSSKSSAHLTCVPPAEETNSNSNSNSNSCSESQQASEYESDFDTDIDEPPRSSSAIEENRMDMFNYRVYAGEEKQSVSMSMYLDACAQLSIMPSRLISAQLDTTCMTLRHAEIQKNELMALLMTICSNSSIIKLDLRNTRLDLAMLDQVRIVLGENDRIQELDISENELKNGGVLVIAQIIRDSDTLTAISMGSNLFDDDDLVRIVQAMRSNDRLTKVDLSKNVIGTRSGSALAELVKQNVFLEKLNLSWNQIRSRGGEQLVDALRTNKNLTSLNLAFNGIGDDGAKRIKDVLKVNNVLMKLDLDSNRITNEGAKHISHGLASNSTLEVLKLSGNPITKFGVQFLLAAIYKANSLRSLHIQTLALCPVSIRILNKCIEERPWFDVRHGFVSHFEGKNYFGKDYATKMQIYAEIRKHLKKNKLRLIELFNNWDKRTKTGYLTFEQLSRGLSDSGIPITTSMLQTLFTTLDANNDGIITYVEFAAMSHLDDVNANP